MLYKVLRLKYLAKLVLADIFVSKVGVSPKIAQKRHIGEKKTYWRRNRKWATKHLCKGDPKGANGGPIGSPL